ncbi:MAG TPA: Pycsar system effector family protein [Thermobifida alba]|nr:Pycsar system effector family protein [Thermobifida alba]
MFGRRPRRPVPAAEQAAPTVLDRAAEDAQTVLQRTDTVNSTLATMSGVLLTVMAAGSGLADGDGTYPTAALWTMGAAAAVLAAVLVVLAGAMWPRRGGRGGVPHYATLTPAQVQRELAGAHPTTWQAERVAVLSRIAVRKHRAQRAAVTGLALGGLLLAASVLLTVTAAA